MTRFGFGFPSLIIGFYAWISAVFLGGILLDIQYSRLLADVLENSERSAVYNVVSDFLLLIGVLMVLAGAAAVVVSWKSRLARYLILASLVVFLFEFLTPVFLSQFIQEAQTPGIDSFIRLLPVGLASLLAFFGLFAYFPQKLDW